MHAEELIILIEIKSQKPLDQRISVYQPIISPFDFGNRGEKAKREHPADAPSSDGRSRQQTFYAA
jgi:hypothetical protein